LHYTAEKKEIEIEVLLMSVVKFYISLICPIFSVGTVTETKDKKTPPSHPSQKKKSASTGKISLIRQQYFGWCKVDLSSSLMWGTTKKIPQRLLN